MKPQVNQYLKCQAKFSMNEIIPILEQRISKCFNMEFVIYPWICDFDDMNYDILKYIALPKQAAKEITNAFTKNNTTYIYNIRDKNHAYFYQATKKDKKNYLEKANYLQTLIDGGLAFVLTEKMLSKEELPMRLISDFKEEYYLWDSIFVYPEDLSFLDTTIENFAKQKIKTPLK